MTRKGLRALDLWGRTESRLISLFTSALQILQHRVNPGMDENEINRELALCLRQANRSLPERERFDHLPFYEARNQPDATDPPTAPREHKRPDFQWELIDHQHPDPATASRYFAIECKILGTPSSSRWIYNSNYVEHGIKRFIEAAHGYGQSSPSGAMVGYIQGMSHPHTLAEVNAACLQASVPSIQPIPTTGSSHGIRQLTHSFDRLVQPSPFRLHHLWLSLRAPIPSSPGAAPSST